MHSIQHIGLVLDSYMQSNACSCAGHGPGCSCTLSKNPVGLPPVAPVSMFNLIQAFIEFRSFMLDAADLLASRSSETVLRKPTFVEFQHLLSLDLAEHCRPISTQGPYLSHKDNAEQEHLLLKPQIPFSVTCVKHCRSAFPAPTCFSK